MLRTSSALGLAALLAGSLLGCKKDAALRPNCFSGTVVANTCMQGVLIDVDPAYPIGAPAVSMAGNRFLGNNVVAVSRSASLQNISNVGQRLYFNYTNAPAPDNSLVICCLAADGTTTPVPEVALTNVSTVSCDSVQTK